MLCAAFMTAARFETARSYRYLKDISHVPFPVKFEGGVPVLVLRIRRRIAKSGGYKSTGFEETIFLFGRSFWVSGILTADFFVKKKKKPLPQQCVFSLFFQHNEASIV